MPDPTIPNAPVGLQAPGRRLWKRVVEAYELGVSELAILAAAAKLADELQRLEDELAKAPTMTEGSKGQERPTPLFSETRQHRLAFVRTMQALGLDAAEETERSERGRKMARLRWSGRGG